MAKYDLLIKNGLIVDGQGGEPYKGNVAIIGDKIVAVGAFDGDAKEAIDAEGKIVTPGFVDIHTHYDGQSIWSERLSPSSSHGVTTVIMGNCGVGFAPCRLEDHQTLIKVMEGVEDIPDAVMAEGLPWDWETFPQYLDALEERKRDIDVGAFLPHSPVRVYAMGNRGANREVATPEDLKRMHDITVEALHAGAMGFATSRLSFHRMKDGALIPTYDAARAELSAITSAMKETGKGVVQMVLDIPDVNWDKEVQTFLSVVKESGRPATFTLGTGNSGVKAWESAVDAIADANARGAQIKAQVMPRPIGMVSGFELSTHPFCMCVSYLPLAKLPLAEQLPTLRDPAFREKLINEPGSNGHPLAMMTRNWDWVFPMGDIPNYEPALETSVGAQARAQGRRPEEVAYDLMMNGGKGDGKFYTTLGNFYEGKLDELYTLMNDPNIVVGLGDGGAHYSSICDASYPTFMLTYWARDRKGPRLTLPQVVRALSGATAETVQLFDRGKLAPGYKADVNVIDLDALTLHGPVIRYDLPGKGRRLDQEATGYVATICNGQVIRRNDQPTEARPGRVIRGTRSLMAAE